MNKTAFIKHLRATADVLTPLTRSIHPGSRVWDGTNYVAVAGANSDEPDPYALVWWSKLLAIADLIEAQDSPISAKQLEWLRGALFGGAGSLNDLYFDRAVSEKAGSDINETLRRNGSLLFQAFSEAGS